MKNKIRLIWQLYPSYLFIICVSLAAVSLYISGFIEHFLLETTEHNLLVRGELLKSHINQLLTRPDKQAIDSLLKQIGANLDTRITVIDTDGTVIGDSEEAPSAMDNHKNRPEILTALTGTHGTAIRNSSTLKIRMMYVAMPLYHQDRMISILRISIPIPSISRMIKSVQERVLLVGLAIVLIASVLAYFLSRLISKPIEEMKKGADKFADGDLDHRLHEPHIDEFSGLADAMNHMAMQLKERIETVKNQRNEYEAVLSSMSEGVIGIDREERILNINQAAMDILELSRPNSQGRSIQEVIRVPDFHRFISQVVSSPEQEEGDFELYNLGNRIINTKSAPLRDSSDKRMGTLIVLKDVTQVRHLENVRKDFVANVSHEIKTPLTAIKGFVETLINDAEENPENRARFLGIIMKHVDRLNAILEDLLVLARLEQKQDTRTIIFETTHLREIVETALQVVQTNAGAKDITVSVDVDERLTACIDVHLIEQALVNLIDNAVKYSPEGTTVTVSARLNDEEGLTINVRDHGPGIPAKHLQRIFERFYRVDKARSRKLGGTGLGLSIVKHIASVHGGHVSVESEPGKGTTFSIHLPGEQRIDSTTDASC